MKLIFIRHGDPCKDSFSISKKGILEIELLKKFFKEKKISEVLSATSIRGKETTYYFLKDTDNILITYCSWLNEFKHKVVLPNGNKQFPWELPIEYWCNDKKIIDQIYKTGDINYYANLIWSEFDNFLSNKGYTRNKNSYKVIRKNEECYIFITHFATISVILSHLLNIPLEIMLHAFWQAPSAYTTLITEEMEKGKAIFRCIGYGETSHLVKNEELKSYYGLQSEIIK